MRLGNYPTKLASSLNSTHRQLLAEWLGELRGKELEALATVTADNFRHVQGRAAMLADLKKHFENGAP